jgi:hypothetical protein
MGDRGERALSRAQLGDCLLLADTATVLLLDGAARDRYGEAGRTGLDGRAPDLALHRPEVDQATGMLTLQLGVTATEVGALNLFRAVPEPLSAATAAFPPPPPGKPRRDTPPSPRYA